MNNLTFPNLWLYISFSYFFIYWMPKNSLFFVLLHLLNVEKKNLFFMLLYLFSTWKKQLIFTVLYKNSKNKLLIPDIFGSLLNTLHLTGLSFLFGAWYSRSAYLLHQLTERQWYFFHLISYRSRHCIPYNHLIRSKD